MRTSVCLHDTGTIVLRSPLRAVATSARLIPGGRYLGWAALGVLLAVGIHAGLSASAASARIEILAALAGGLGVLLAWQGFDSTRLGRALAGIGAGTTVTVLAIAALPASTPLLATALAIAGAAAAVNHARETGLWVPTAAASLTLAILGLA